MKFLKALMTTLLFVALIGGCAGKGMRGGKAAHLPPGTLNAAEVTELFAGKTVESVLDKSGRISLSYYNPNGELRQLQNGEKRTGTWEVRNDGRMCLAFPGGERQCRIIVKEGEVYRKYIVKLNGEHIPVLTYKSFREGNLVDK
jgi:hypothetical protein